MQTIHVYAVFVYSNLGCQREEMCGQLHLECVIGMVEGRIISFKVVCGSKNNEMANYI